MQYVINLDRVIAALDYNGLKRLHHMHTQLDTIYRASNLYIRCFEKSPCIVNNDVMCQQANMFWEPKHMLLVAYITAYVVMYNWLYNGFWTRTGGWEFWLLPWRWHISIPLKTGRGISANICGLDDVFHPVDLGSGPCTPFIICIPQIIARFLLIEINSFYVTYIPKVGVTMLVYWMIWCCLVSGVLSVLCHGMDIGTCDIVHWSAAPHHCIAIRTVFVCALF